MRLRNASRMTRMTLALLPWGLLLGACSSNGIEGNCPDGVTCGGSPVGVWNTVGRCQFAANRSDQPLTPSEQIALPIIPVLTSSPIPATTQGDQCSQLIISPENKITSVNLYHDAPGIISGQVAFNADATYSVSLKFGVTNTSHFTPYCLQAAGANPACTDFASALTAYYTAAATADAAGTPQVDFVNIACGLAADSGCDCRYDYTVTLADKGAWGAAGTTVTQSSAPSGYTLNGKPAGSQAPASVMGASICQSGDQLTLSGYNGSPLFHAPGLRVLTLQRQ